MEPSLITYQSKQWQPTVRIDNETSFEEMAEFAFCKLETHTRVDFVHDVAAKGYMAPHFVTIPRRLPNDLQSLPEFDAEGNFPAWLTELVLQDCPVAMAIAVHGGCIDLGREAAEPVEDVNFEVVKLYSASIKGDILGGSMEVIRAGDNQALLGSTRSDYPDSPLIGMMIRAMQQIEAGLSSIDGKKGVLNRCRSKLHL